MGENTLNDIVQLITALTAFGAMVVSGVVALRVNKVVEKVEQVHQATNGMQNKLLEVTATAAHAEGVEVGRKLEKES